MTVHQDTPTSIQFRMAARGLIVQNNRLLLVSDDGEYWYLPGGRLENSENLRECVEREVYEETGLMVKTGPLLHVLECFDLRDHLHKINFYFQATVLKGSLSDAWNDEGGTVQFRQYFSLEEIQKNARIIPRFLAAGDWCREDSSSVNHTVYQECIWMRGFETVEFPEEELSLAARM